MLQARQIFDHICPGEDFLPRAPNPEDIIWDDGEGNQPKDSGFSMEQGSSDGEVVAQEEPVEKVITNEEIEFEKEVVDNIEKTKNTLKKEKKEDIEAGDKKGAPEKQDATEQQVSAAIKNLAVQQKE